MDTESLHQDQRILDLLYMSVIRMTRVAHFCKESDTFWSLSSELNIAPIRIFTINSRWAWVPLERVGSYLTVSTISCTKLVSKSYD